MAVREDWTRITQSIHDLFLSPRSSAGGALGRTSIRKLNTPRVQPRAILVRSAIEPRILTEIERRRSQVYQSNLRNQIR